MSIFEKIRRSRVVTSAQHPYRHTLSEFAYSNDSLPGVTNALQVMDTLIQLFYPNTRGQVADIVELNAIVGQSISDYYVVLDDGDGKAAGYQWQQREGDATPKWYKINDMDWGLSNVLTQYLNKTHDVFVYRYGYDDTDETGALLAGDLAGQHISGGATAGSHLTFHANSGDGVGPQTGFIQFDDDVRPLTDSVSTLGTTGYRWSNFFSDAATVATMTFGGGSITDSSGAISFGDENLSTTGTFASGVITRGTLVLDSGLITDTSGLISFDDEDLVTTGIISGGQINGDNLRIDGNTLSSTDTDGNIILDPDGTGFVSIPAGVQGLESLAVDNLLFDGNTISTTDLNGSLVLVADGTGVIDVNSAMETLDQTVIGDVDVTGSLTVDSLIFNSNNISTPVGSGTNILFSPDGIADVIFDCDAYPLATGTYNLGANSQEWNTLHLSDKIRNGVTDMPMSVLMTLRDVTFGVSDGDVLFYDSGLGRFRPSAPDLEIDHGAITGLGDDDHAQYGLLAGRSGGQTLIGGVDANDNLLLESTSNATKGQILAGDDFYPDVNITHDLGGPSNNWVDLYMTGQAFGMRVENAADGTARGLLTPTEGRLSWQVDTEELYIGLGASWKQIGTDAYYFEDTTGWTGAVTTVTYDVSSFTDDARKMVWQFKDNSNNYEIMVPKIDHPTSTDVRVTFGIAPSNATYTLVGR